MSLIAAYYVGVFLGYAVMAAGVAAVAGVVYFGCITFGKFE